MTDTSRPGQPRSFLAPMLGILVLFVTLVAYLDRRTLVVEKQILQEEIWNMDARLEAASDAVGLRLELERQAREIESLRHAVGATQQAIEAAAAPGTRILPLTPPSGEARGWLVLPATSGAAFLVCRDLPQLAEGAELAVEGAMAGGARELARIQPGRDGRGAAAFRFELAPEDLTAIRLRTLASGVPTAGQVLLSWEPPATTTPVTAEPRG